MTPLAIAALINGVLWTLTACVLIGVFLVQGWPKRRSLLPRRVPGMNLAAEQVAWDVLVRQLRAKEWTYGALTEATAPHRIIEGTVYEGVPA